MSRPDNDEIVDIKFDKIIRQTEKAFLVDVEAKRSGWRKAK